MANKESLEVIKFVVSLSNGIVKTMADGKVDFSDIIYLLETIKNAPAAFEGIQLVPDEVKNWSEAEKAEALKAIEMLDLEDDQKEMMIEKVLKAGVSLAEIILGLLPGKVTADLKVGG